MSRALCYLLLILTLDVVCFSFVGTAIAAPLFYANNTDIYLSSLQTTLTIQSGSRADGLVVNATSVVITLSNTTGSSFTLLSPSYDLSVATSSGGGTITISCSGGIETATLSQSTGSTVYTVSPSGTNCASASPPVITSIAATNVTTNSATIAWTTNSAAASTVSYGTTAAYGATSADPALITAHTILLSNLSPGTLYHYAVASSEYGTSTTSGDNTFTTAAVTSGGGGGVSTGGGESAYDLSINGGEAQTATTSVTLSLYGTAAYTMEISNTSTFAGAAWIPYATAMPWTLAPDPGIQTVYTQFQAVDGTIVGVAHASIAFAPAGTPVVTVTSSSTTSSTASLTAELASLQAQLAALLKQASQSAVAPTSAHFVFTRNLSFGMTGNDVKELQQFLISQNTGLAARKLKTHGATKNFGTLTQDALVEFQKKTGIKPAIGFFGPITRAHVNARQ